MSTQHQDIKSDDEDLIKHTTARYLDEVLESRQQFGGGLGFGSIGNPDDRMLWLKFRWCLEDKPKAKTKRVMDLGKDIEKRVINYLASLPGVEIHDRDPGTAKQFKTQFLGGHFSGLMDGCGVGFPEAPKAWHVIEIKGANDRGFKEVQKVGVQEWNGEYYANVQCHMGATGIERTLFVVVNRDSGEIHVERIQRERLAFEGYLSRAERLILADDPPVPLYESASKVPKNILALKADYKSMVYWGIELPKPNCRNCRFSQPLIEGSSGNWRCSYTNTALDYNAQRQGCPSHNFMPSLVSANLVEQYSDCVEYELGGQKFWNAEDNAAAIHDSVFSSNELCHLSHTGLGLCAESLFDPELNKIRTAFDGRIIEGMPNEHCT